MSKDKITIDDLAGMIQNEFTNMRSDFKDGFDKLSSEINAVKNDVHSLTHRASNVENELKEVKDKLDADKFALSHITKDHEKRITVLEHKAA